MTGKLAVVFGGSGFVGRNVVRDLARRGWRVRVGVRRPHLAQFLRPMGAVGQIQLCQVNLRHKPSVAAAMKGADVVVNLVGIMHQDGPQSFQSVQSGGAELIARLASQAGAEQLVHVSAIGADTEADSLYAKTKGEGEVAVLQYFPGATIVRPSIVFGQEDKFFNKFATMATMSPALPLIGGGETKFQPIYVDDLATAICATLETPGAKARVFEIGGPKIYTFRTLMEMMLSEIGRQRILVPVPFPIAALLGMFGEITGRLPFVTPVLTRDQVKLLKRDNVVADDADIGTIGDLGVTPTSVEAMLPTYMVPYRRYGQFAEDPA